MFEMWRVTLLCEHNSKPTCETSVWWPTFYTYWNWLCWSALYSYTHNSFNKTNVYICLFTCALTRAIHFKFTGMLTADFILPAFWQFVARRGLPAKTFKAASKEIQRVVCSPEVANYFTNNYVTWKFIVDRAFTMVGKFLGTHSLFSQEMS